jgi:YVTN family beta-propeller protein
VRFLRAFDSRRLHRCAARYSQRLAPGHHILRVQAIGRDGRRSRGAAVSIVVRVALPLAATIRVGRHPGVPVVAGGSVWVPNTGDGTVSRIDPATNAVTGTIRVADASPASADGFLDTAAAGFGSIWIASDYHHAVARIDPASGAVVARIAVAERPLGIAITPNAVWIAHFLSGTLTRIAPATNAVRTFTLPDTRLVGIAALGDELWALGVSPTRAFRVDPADGSPGASVALVPALPPQRSFLGAWWLAPGADAVWATLPNHDAVARIIIGKVEYLRIPTGRPFGVAVDRTTAWVATEAALVRLSGTAVTGVARIPRAGGSGFVSVAAGAGAAWGAGYERGEVYRVG